MARVAATVLFLACAMAVLIVGTFRDVEATQMQAELDEVI